MQLRERLLMDRNWRFHLGDIAMHDCRHVWSKVRNGTKGPVAPDFDDAAWRTVDLPHDFVVEGTFSRGTRTLEDPYPLAMTDTEEVAKVSHGYLPVSVGWYRKRFELGESDGSKRIHLVFDGLYRDAVFWLNGLYLDRHQSGYTECRIDVTDLLVYGNEGTNGNVLAVRVDARQSEGWFYEGGGIYRHVWLEKTGPVAVAPNGTFVWTRGLSGEGASVSAELEIRTEIRNDTDDPVGCGVTWTVIDTNGTPCAQVKESIELPGGGSGELVRAVTIPSPRLWDLDDPHLHTLVTEVAVGKQLADRAETTFGIRTIEFDADRGFFLNGRGVKIKGVCVHQNHAGVGTAMPDKLFAYRVEQLKKLGCNAYRCAHYPHATELLDACDRIGMLVMDETRSFSSGPEFMRQHESMLRRDRNHPSIVIYCMGNEEWTQNTPIGERMMLSIRRLAKRLDPSRPLTTANNSGEMWGTASKHLDVLGCNYCPEEYDGYHRKHPLQPMIATETSSRVTTRGIYAHDPHRGHVDAYDREVCDFFSGRMSAEEMWRGIAARPFISGAFVWTGIDYKGESGPYHWPTVSSHFGMLDSCCFPKDIAYYFKTWWTDTSDLHIFPHWNWEGREGETIDVWCYARHERVELLLNGDSLGTRDMPEMGHVSWKVPYQPGVLEAKGIRGGTVIAVKRVETTGRPSAVELETDHREIKADGEDVAVVNVSVVDEKGRTVPTADNPVAFEVNGNGRIIGVGNGDPSSHEQDRAAARKAFGGRCQVLVQSVSAPGEIVVSAQSPGLAGGVLRIASVRSRIRPSV